MDTEKKMTITFSVERIEIVMGEVCVYMSDLLAFKPPADVIGGKWKKLILEFNYNSYVHMAKHPIRVIFALEVEVYLTPGVFSSKKFL